jgi:hypothetical protein
LFRRTVREELRSGLWLPFFYSLPFLKIFIIVKRKNKKPSASKNAEGDINTAVPPQFTVSAKKQQENGLIQATRRKRTVIALRCNGRNPYKPTKISTYMLTECIHKAKRLPSRTNRRLSVKHYMPATCFRSSHLHVL